MKSLLFTILIFCSLIVNAQPYNKPNGDVTLPPGNYEVINMSSGKLTINTETKIQNINNFSNSTIEVSSLGNVTVNNIHLNGSANLINRGILNISTGSTEQQNGNNTITNYGIMTSPISQILDNTSKLILNGCTSKFTVTKTFSFNKGSIEFIDGAQLIVGGADINVENGITGKGYFEVINNLTLNKTLTQSTDIRFCYKGTASTSNIGKAIKSCDKYICNPLPLKTDKPVFIYVKDNQGKLDHILWSINVIDSFGNTDFKFKVSNDVKGHFETIVSEKIDMNNPNKIYSGIIPLK